MKKNILLLLPLISTASTFSMELRPFSMEQHPLAQTVMGLPPVVKDESLGLWRFGSDFLYEPDNLHSDLSTGKYDPANQQYIDKLDRTIGTFAHTNDPRLPETLDFCRDKYKGKINIKEEKALAAHICLTNEIKTKLSALKPTLETNDKNFLEEQNKLLTALKESFAKEIAIITTNLESHKKNRDDLLKQEGDQIRKNKKAALVSHRLSRFTVPHDGHCSDDEQHPDKVEEFYTDQHLKAKMGIDESTFATVNKIDKALRILNELNGTLQGI